MKPIISLSVAMAAAISFSSCVAPSNFDSSGNTISTQQNTQFQQLGKREFTKIKQSKKVSYNSTYNAQVRRVANRLKRVISLPGAEWEFVVFQDKTPNAFALPGGKIGVHTGLFQVTQNDAGLAAVLAHEIAHVTGKHSESQYRQRQTTAMLGSVLGSVLSSRGGQGRNSQEGFEKLYGAGSKLAVSLPNSRRHELEADRIGALYMARAGYDPREAVALWKRFSAYRSNNQGGQGPEFLRTHPVDNTRIQALQKYMPTALREYKAR